VSELLFKIAKSGERQKAGDNQRGSNGELLPQRLKGRRHTPQRARGDLVGIDDLPPGLAGVLRHCNANLTHAPRSRRPYCLRFARRLNASEGVSIEGKELL
jgi:hypothetical protein